MTPTNTQDYAQLVGSVITSIAVGDADYIAGDDADGEAWIGLVCETQDGTMCTLSLPWRSAWISRDDEGGTLVKA